jgi:hypothetical protein
MDASRPKRSSLNKVDRELLPRSNNGRFAVEGERPKAVELTSPVHFNRTTPVHMEHFLNTYGTLLQVHSLKGDFMKSKPFYSKNIFLRRPIILRRLSDVAFFYAFLVAARLLLGFLYCALSPSSGRCFIYISKEPEPLALPPNLAVFTVMQKNIFKPWAAFRQVGTQFA